ncbi:TRIC cation channel family protein [Bifidobacterium sp. B4107]|uniref:trimeric intracellular cation channel family protein n=1 Tax=unclassified Bifidobacterium TaxID=2608897 RepID=UPI00226B8F7E|nr:MULTISPECIES: TRIC cation channel family protein [unclassified Bifidobacterium]MCX8647475.1 TRIC cation channel family protein [Bifidobacterium sp. B4107]MCX8651655.1 TRIC cation channel family protein [Bifidobacterium sp. B4111]MCX8658086.1 TRIC cation channel family protein [Bifidobacterium sp. B4114]
MKTALEGNLIFMVIEYLGIFSCGLSGGLAAVRKGYDIIAILLVSWISALGGGVVRDVLLGQVPPSGITDKGSVIVTLASGLVVAVAHPEISRMTWSMLVTDAMALGSFAVNGTAKALMCGTGGMTAIFMGMATALVGGLLRDILLNQVPAVIQDQHWYALPSLIGCLLTLASARARQHGLYPVRVDMALDLAIVALVVVLRIISVKFDILVPGAMDRRSARLPLNDAQLTMAIRHLMRGRSDISVTIQHDDEDANENSKGEPGVKKGR